MLEHISKIAQWFLDLLLYLPKQIWSWMLDSLASLIEAIPVPSFINTAQSALHGIPPGVLFYANLFAIPEGVSMVIAALVLRFIVRRIPLIG